MLIPRFSIRLMLTVTAICAVIFLVGNYAARGQTWALAILAAVLSAVILSFIFAALFFVAYLFSFSSRYSRPVIPESPFATDKLPPQVIPPREVD